MTPEVSILIPVFNRQSFIAECIRSALNQTFDNIEVIIVDNASVDGTWEVCERFATLDKRIRIIRNAVNIGPVRNWKRCAEEARAKYSKILFSDDALEPNCISEMISEIRNEEIGLVFSAALIGESRVKARLSYSLSANCRMKSHRLLNLISQDEAPVSPGAVLLRTSDLRENILLSLPTKKTFHFDRHGAGPDLMISLLTAEKYKYIAHVSTPLVFFRVHAESLSIKNTSSEITQSYLAALAYYFQSKRDGNGLLRYLAREWLKANRRMRTILNPIVFLSEYQGVHKTRALPIFLLYAIVIAMNFTRRKMLLNLRR